jgi:hypothetical protein
MSLKDLAFGKLSRKDKLAYLNEVTKGNVSNIDRLRNPLFMTETEYHKNRTQRQRDLMPEIYKDVPRLEGTGKTNKWISHVKAYQAKHGCSYKEAMQRSKETYIKGGGLKFSKPKPVASPISIPRARREEPFEPYAPTAIANNVEVGIIKLKKVQQRKYDDILQKALRTTMTSNDIYTKMLQLTNNNELNAKYLTEKLLSDLEKERRFKLQRAEEIYERTSSDSDSPIEAELVGEGKSNKWIRHVKAYQAKHGCSYKEAMKKSKKTYKKKMS